MKLNIRQKILSGFGLALVMLAVIAVITYRSTRGFVATAQGVAHTQQVLGNREALLRHLTEAESSASGFVITKNDRYVKSFEGAQERIAESLENLKQLSAEEPAQLERLERLTPLISRKLAILNDAIAAKRDQGGSAAAELFSQRADGTIMHEIARVLTEFENEERQVLSQRTSLILELGRSTTFIIVLSSVLSVLFVVVASVIILRDIGARRRAEEALAEEHNLIGSIMDTLPDQVFVKDLNSRYVMDNVAHRAFLGATRLEEVEGKTAFDFFPHEMAEFYDEDDSAVMKTGKGVFDHEEPSVDREGRLTWLSTTKVPLRDTDGRMIGIVCVSANIVARKENEEKLRLAATQLQRSNHELQEFASVASHDLQEPLRKIQAFGDRLRRKCADALGEDGRDYLERMQDAARRMQILLHDLLTLSRITSQAQPFVELDLGKIAHDVVSDLEVRIEQSGARIEIGNLPAIDADPIQMRQLFQNLISNALKFQRPGTTPEVEILAKTLEVEEHVLAGASPGDKVCQIVVRDNGIGFDEKYAERIFAVFQRLHSRSEYEGTGIGLAVCRKILDRHGGTICAKSSEGEGATFIVTLPVKQRMKATDEQAG